MSDVKIGNNCLVVGADASTQGFDNCVVIGDDLEARYDYHLLVGDLVDLCMTPEEYRAIYDRKTLFGGSAARRVSEGGPPPNRQYLVRRYGRVFVAAPAHMGPDDPVWVVATAMSNAGPVPMDENDQYIPLDTVEAAVPWHT